MSISRAYEQAATTKPLIGFVTLYKDQKKVFETQAIVETPGFPVDQAGIGAAKLHASVLKSLPEGEYDCQVNVLDPTGQKGTFWRGQIKLTP